MASFKIDVQNLEGLFKHIQQPHDLIRIGGYPLPNPLESINISTQSNGTNYLLKGGVDYTLSQGNKKDILTLLEHIQTDYSVKIINDKTGIISSPPRKEEIIVRKLPSGLEIVMGRDSCYSTGENQISSLDEFSNRIALFTKVIEHVINGVYVSEKQEPPDLTMPISSPLAVTHVGGDSGNPIKGLDTLKSQYGSKIDRSVQITKGSELQFQACGGQKEAVREIEGISFALKNPGLYKKWGTRPPRGILLNGPPGNGKTLLAKILASQAEATLYHALLSDIFNMWVGEAEKIVDDLFTVAGQNGRSIIYFDELDALAPSRGGKTSEVSRRVLSSLLTNMDGLETKGNIMCLGSTNRLDMIDSALTRPGRFDKIVLVPNPDGQGRTEIFYIHKENAEKTAERPLFSDNLDAPKIMQLTEGYSGADIAEIIRRALEEKVRIEGQTGSQPGIVTTEDLCFIIESYQQTRETKQREIGFNSGGH